MSNEDLIKKCLEEKLKIEMNISREEDSLLKYQLNNDENSVNDCKLRLDNLYSDLSNIENTIARLKKGDGNSLDLPIPTNNALSINDIPIDKGTATIGLTVTNKVKGTVGFGKDKTNIRSKETRRIEKTYKIDDGEIVQETITERKESQMEKTKDDMVDVKSKIN